MRYLCLTSRTITTEPGPLCVPIDHSPGEAFGQSTALIPGTQFQFAWDSVSINLFKTCPRKYQYEILQGYVPRDTAPPLMFGIFFHTCMENWHKLLAVGLTKENALKSIALLALFLGENLPPSDSARTKETLTRAVVWYIDQFWDDRAKTVILPSGKPAVELSFRIPICTVNGTQIDLCGHIDRLVTFMDETYPCDYKSTKYQLDQRFFDGFSPSTQMQNYTIASQVAFEQPSPGIIIDGIQLGVNFARFQRHVAKFSPEYLDEYLKGFWYWVNLAAQYAEQDFWPMNEESCGKYSGCHFRQVCSQAPSMREHYLRGKYARRLWDPLKAR